MFKALLVWTKRLVLIISWILQTIVVTGCSKTSSLGVYLLRVSNKFGDASFGFGNTCVRETNVTTTCTNTAKLLPGSPTVDLVNLRTKFVNEKVHPWLVYLSYALLTGYFLSTLLNSLPLLKNVNVFVRVMIPLGVSSTIMNLIALAFVNISVCSFALAFNNNTSSSINIDAGQHMLGMFWTALVLVFVATVADSILLATESKSSKSETIPAAEKQGTFRRLP
ncbi:tetraspan protein Dni1 [Schizosaccharomyces japonicus yFS275]|uniref:Tetraspan protein Dni1 n=1 Tax=Schizosaccharomyces japonicus (strain yFS275 / FY16936) TaxID=402676 RepID=B6K1J5_SCHJY|nr:tetraspan protein Dni1 [Schizosaccharomyces japonicus yFS275]EEB07816.2 tetraspan protein Dni1 [Schizosaccharomyces japonicus yFS275]